MEQGNPPGDALRARLAEPNDTEARVQRIMGAADSYAKEHALVGMACAVHRLGDAETKYAPRSEAARAELERVVREAMR